MTHTHNFPRPPWSPGERAGIPVGLPSLDDLLPAGLPYGGLTFISGHGEPIVASLLREAGQWGDAVMFGMDRFDELLNNQDGLLGERLDATPRWAYRNEFSATTDLGGDQDDVKLRTPTSITTLTQWFSARPAYAPTLLVLNDIQMSRPYDRSASAGSNVDPDRRLAAAALSAELQGLASARPFGATLILLTKWDEVLLDALLPVSRVALYEAQLDHGCNYLVEGRVGVADAAMTFLGAADVSG